MVIPTLKRHPYQWLHKPLTLKKKTCSLFQRFHKVFQKIYGLRFTLPICWSSQKAASLSPTDRIFHWPSGLPANVGRNDRSLAACTARASSSPTGWNPTNGFPRKWVTLMFGQILLGAGEIFFFGGGSKFPSSKHHPKKRIQNLQNVTKFQGNDPKKRWFGERRKASLGVFFSCRKNEARCLERKGTNM